MKWKHNKEWKELSLPQRAAIVRDIKDRQESPEGRQIRAALRESSKAQERKAAKMAKLRAYLLARHTPKKP